MSSINPLNKKNLESSVMKLGINKPGHELPVIQSPISSARPAHGSPPSAGLGFVHVLVLVYVPDPHEAEQELHSPQWDQFPFTANKNKKINTKLSFTETSLKTVMLIL